ncbi:plasma membrane zinc ion transporter, putative [Metarhizium acridum CQMa 102]|uniref:Plasma membrane zinc ion transporter, putative n=1 Tax=Metarhizium acridum (strain CQMa 102) TaxID=655827 RepID=E9DSH6_METAQ|nr:plasma membrane zinc ion transporter, putative [Metarhizium acridum CQMa 102]EFY93336.1 plasma membrane zinc ion transporter, putative [Metarhizium acridum CQMa 102]
MICLNKADEGSFRHLTYNQSPPALAANQTTRQDLNGISNLREYVAANQDDASGGETGGMLGETPLNDKLRREGEPHLLAQVPDARRWVGGPFLRFKAVAGFNGQNRLVWVHSARCLERLWSWLTWILSVLFFSYLISNLRMSTYRTGNEKLLSNIESTATNSSTLADAFEMPEPSFRQESHGLKKRSSCASGGVNKDQYNTGLHVAALFIIWFVSTLGCAFPIMAAKFPGLRIPRRFFFAVRHFGTGVLIATAFVHLLPTAFVSLGNPCLGTFWTEDYNAMPGAIALAAIFLVTIIEMVFHPSRHVPPADIVAKPRAKEQEELETTDSDGHPIRDMGPLRGRSSSMAQGLSQLNQAAPSEEISAKEPVADSAIAKSVSNDCHDATEQGECEQTVLTPEQKRKKDRLQCILLEMGILFHSVFIGMALSVSIGNDFIVLLIAIVFHQTFEGLALGSRISVIEWGDETWQPWLMALAYGFTYVYHHITSSLLVMCLTKDSTPIGQAIGLATHMLYSPDSEVGLILVGVMNAISAGLLTFASLVELLSEDFLSDESWRHLRGKNRIIACLLVFFGAFGMSLVGAWA